MTDDFEKIGQLEDFRTSKAKETRIGDLHIAVFSVDGRMYAVENNCPHQHFEVLHQGNLEGCTITCPMHGRTFDLETGNCLNGAGRLKNLEVKTVENEIWVRKPAAKSFALFDE